jgi:DNA-binding beta-propeller fold protein YncE
MAVTQTRSGLRVSDFRMNGGGKNIKRRKKMFRRIGRGGSALHLETAATPRSQATNGRWHFLSILVFASIVSTASPAPANEAAPLQLLQAVPLPGFSGDFDHFAVDEKGGRLFLAGEDHKTVEVFDLKTGRRLKSITGFGTPHSIIYLPETDRILVADGDKGMLQILRGSDYALLEHVDGLAGADSMRLDEPAQILYVVTGGKDVPLDYSFLVAIDLKTKKKVSELRIESNHVEAFALESSSSRMFVNITDKHAVAVVDRKAMKEITRWPIGSQADNSPMAYDELHRRLLIVCRKPGTLVVMNSDTGKVVKQLPAAERSDDIAFDAEKGRVYVPGGEGYISVFQQKTADQYELVGKVTSEPGAKTCLLVPSLLRYFVAVSPGETKAAAKVLTFKVLP